AQGRRFRLLHARIVLEPDVLRERALTGQRSAVPSDGAALRLRASWLVAAIRARGSRVLPDTGAPVRTPAHHRPDARYHAEPAARHSRISEAWHLLGARSGRLL